MGIFLAGRAGSGKSPLARCIVRELEGEHDLRAEVCSFADALKQEVWELFGLEKGDLLGRETLIKHGEERRALDPTYWVRRLMPKIKALQEDGIVPIVDDVRREPEYARLVYEGFYSVRLITPVHLRRAALERAGLDPDFAESNDCTEVDHACWMYQFTRVMSHTPRDFQQAAEQIVAGAMGSGMLVAV